MGACVTTCYGCCGCAECAESFDPELDAALRDKSDFSFAGKRFRAKVVQVYDGDTIRVKIRHRGEIQQFVARLAGIDAPEMKPKKAGRTREDIDAEKKAAIASRDALGGKIGLRVVRIKIEDSTKEKFGRLLAQITADGLDVNKWMVDNGHAVAYDGGTKQAFGAEAIAHDDEKKGTKPAAKKSPAARATKAKKKNSSGARSPGPHP